MQEVQGEQEVVRDTDALLPQQRFRGGTQALVQRPALTELEDEAALWPIDAEREETDHVRVGDPSRTRTAAGSSRWRQHAAA